MSIVYVSALYNIYNSQTVSERLIKDFTKLISRDIRLILYVDSYYQGIIDNLKLKDNITVIHLPLERVGIYNMIIKNKNHLRLPTNRTYEKDTYEYMALMNSKIEFVYRSLSLVNSDYISWIDGGVGKMFKKDETFDKLSKLELVNVNKILIPGCYIRHISFDDLCRNVWWIFLGTFFICPRDQVDIFYMRSLESLGKFIINKSITWEVNIWANIMYEYPNLFQWYQSGHDDGLVP